MAPIQIPGIDIPMLTGPLVLGYMWGYLLYGMLIVQVYMYSETFPNDHLAIKILVWSLFFFETVFTIFTTIAAWNNYGPGWGDPDTLLIIDWSWVPLPALNGFLAAMTQSFYVWRIWSLTKKILLPIFIQCVSFMQVTVAFYYGIVVSIQGRGIDKLFLLAPEISLWLSGSAACDILITISIVTILTRRRAQTTFQETTSTISKLIRFTVETGTITSVGALIELILWLTCRQWNLHFVFFLVLGKLYSNTLMATLNCRAPVFKAHSNLRSPMPTTSAFWIDASGTRSQPRGVHITRTTEILNDVNHETIIMDDFTKNPQVEEGRPSDVRAGRQDKPCRSDL